VSTPADCGRLTVLLVAPASSVHTRRWASALAGAGYRVIVASWQPGRGLPGVDLRIAPAAGKWPGWRMAMAARWLRAMVREVCPDVVHVHSLGAHGLLSLALPAGSLQVATPWGGEIRAARRSVPRGAVIWLTLRRADLVLPTSREVAAELTRPYRVPPGRIRVLSWGVSADLISALPRISAAAVRAEFGIPADATAVLSTRSTSATYRTREIVSAFARAVADRPDLFLVVLAGHRPDRESARRAKDDYVDLVRATAAGVEDRVLLVDRPLSPCGAFELMCACDIAVSIPLGDQRSSSVLEAALAGCRVILSDIPPYREMISDGLTADLLTEPISGTLADRLRTASADATSDCRNRAFILAHENGARKLAELDRIYRQLSLARNSARPADGPAA
jgi:glycosyltransferase involved in cell wall biosynthesis